MTIIKRYVTTDVTDVTEEINNFTKNEIVEIITCSADDKFLSGIKVFVNTKDGTKIIDASLLTKEQI